MPTLKQIAANRRNAQRSTGPRTAEGKAVSRRNSLQSGIYADRETVLPTEDPVALIELRDEYYSHYQPDFPAERCLVDSLISDEWLLRRFRRVEGELLTEANAEISQSAERFCIGTSYRDNERTLERLQRRVNATRKSYLKTLEALAALQAEAQPPAPAARPPVPMSQTAENQEVPTAIGFVPPSATPAPAPRAGNKIPAIPTPSPGPRPRPLPFGFVPPAPAACTLPAPNPRPRTPAFPSPARSTLKPI